MILAIVGPTSVGKTKMSIELAKMYNGEIINCDSTQVYRGLDVGTAKITKAEMEHIPHHLLSFKEIGEDYSVYEFQQDARLCIKKIQDKGKVPILVGGTGFYLKAALYDYNFIEEEALEDDSYEEMSDEEMIKKIESYESGVSIDFHNKRRMVRMLKRLEQGWTPDKKDFKLIYSDVSFIGLTTSRDVLYQKISERFDQMLVPLIDEVKPYFLKGISSKPLMSAIGYKELYSFFENKKTLQEVVEECKKNTRNYAKRQYTWFENQMNITWFSVNYENFKKTIEEVALYIENH